ncbi:MAG: hypothetical protein ACKODU_11720 [Limnohabitans sp.]
MYLVAIAWMYVVVLMSLAEAFASNGTFVGALITFILYGVFPLSILMYIMGTPARKKALAKTQSPSSEEPISDPIQPDHGGHSPSAGTGTAVAPVGKKEG